jgi:hypothetical protein
MLVAVLSTPAAADKVTKSSSDEESSWGFSAKVRVWRLSKRVQKLFVEDSPGPATDRGAGFDFVRRRGSLELNIGFGYDRLTLKDGYYVEKGGNPTKPGDVDYTVFDKFAWVTAEVSVVNHVRLNSNLALRMGGGIGAGWLLGEIRKTDALCTSDRVPEDCMLDPAGMEVDKPADIPPILPVVNVFVGVQVRPFRFLAFNLDAGLHSTPYVGASATIYFP